MRAVIQRVSSAKVSVAGSVTGSIQNGLLVFLGIEKLDTESDLRWLAEKIPLVRCFQDEGGKMNRSLKDIGGEILVISQFTLYGSLRKGTRPSFNRAADPDMAIPLYEQFLERLRETSGGHVAAGIFGAEMQIEASNDGPVTLILDTRNKEL